MMGRNRTLIRIALGIALLFIIADVLFPRSHAWIVGAAPYLLLLLACPLAMFFMMKVMDAPQDKDKKPDQDQVTSDRARKR
jgi:hypothetical protein